MSEGYMLKIKGISRYTAMEFKISTDTGRFSHHYGLDEKQKNNTLFLYIRMRI